MENLRIDNYTINELGLVITYERGMNTIHLVLTPAETCAMLKHVEVIDSFEMFQDEPVILFEDKAPRIDYHGNYHQRSTIGWQYWADFYKDVQTWITWHKGTMEDIVIAHEAKKIANKLTSLIDAICGKPSDNQ